MNSNQILIAYDGSEEAAHAVETAASLFFGQSAIVLYVEQTWPDVAGRAPGALGSKDAAAIATEGASLARSSGLVAEPRADAGSRPAWETIVAVADEVDAATIVIGARGVRGLRSLMLGSVSSQVAHHAHQPVLVVPSPGLAAARRELATGAKHAVA